MEIAFDLLEEIDMGVLQDHFLILIHFFLLEYIFCGIQNLISIFLWCAQFCDFNNSIVFLPSVSKPKVAIFVTWLNICYERLVYLFRSLISVSVLTFYPKS